MITSSVLWHALNHPPTSHPLFWRTVRRHVHVAEKATISLIDRLSVVYLVLFVGAMLLTNMLDLAVQSMALAFLLLLLALPILLPIVMMLRVTLLSGSFFGILWAMRISQHLAREQLNHTYDLLALLPSGGLGSAWAISTGYLYRQHTFTHVLDLRVMVLRFVMLAGAIFMFSEFIGSSNEKWSNLLLLSLQTLTALAVLHIDYIHSTILATLIGMVVPYLTTSDTRLWAAGSFLLFQVVTYALTLFMAVVVLPTLLPANLWLTRALTLVVSGIIFFAIREWLLRASGTDNVKCIFSFSR